MSTIKEKLDADLAAARQKVSELEQQVATLPEEVHQIDESVWEKIKAFLGITS